MRLEELDDYYRMLLRIDEYERIDSSKNGLQVDRRRREIRHAAFAVDAALGVFEEAARIGADLLFVHHGLFWGREQCAVGAHYERLRFLIEHDIALYAVHLPLDAHLELGNNAGIAETLGISPAEPFGLHKGVPIGVAGTMKSPKSLEEITALLCPDGAPLGVLPFGPSRISSVGIISGGAPLDVDQAIALGLDLFITGDANHIAYHRCREAKINAMFAGHYATETYGVQRVARRTAEQTDITTTFVDFPTGL